MSAMREGCDLVVVVAVALECDDAFPEIVIFLIYRYCSNSYSLLCGLSFKL